MLRQHLAGASERRDRARDPAHTSPAPPRERQAIDRSREQLLSGGRQGGGGPAELGPALEHTAPDRLGALAGRRGELVRPRARERDDEIEAVEQRPGQLVAVAIELLRRARAARPRIASATTRTEVHRSDEHETGREEPTAANPGDRHGTVLERLTQGFEH